MIFIFGAQPPQTIEEVEGLGGLFELVNDYGHVVVERLVDMGIDKVVEKPVGLIVRAPGIAIEVGSRIFLGGTAGEGEEAAIAAQQERERERRAAAAVVNPPTRPDVSRADP